MEDERIMRTIELACSTAGRYTRKSRVRTRIKAARHRVEPVTCGFLFDPDESRTTRHIPSERSRWSTGDATPRGRSFSLSLSEIRDCKASSVPHDGRTHLTGTNAVPAGSERQKPVLGVVQRLWCHRGRAYDSGPQVHRRTPLACYERSRR